MATNETPQAPPPPPPVPNVFLLLLQSLVPVVKSPFFHTVLTAILAAFSTVYVAKQSLPAVPEGLRPLLPHILPLPKRAEDAIGRIQFGSAGCTGTIIGPVWSNDSKVDILTAAHCVKLGAVGKMTLKDGRILTVKCVARDPACDAAWLTADKPAGDVPYLYLAEGNPDPGEIVWHQGYGIDKPGNRESGKYLDVASGGKQCRFRLSVSPGDSGGGIILDADSKVVSPVCCTTKLSAVGDVFGAHPVFAAKIRPKRNDLAADETLFYPVAPMPELVAESVLTPPPLR